MKNKKRIISVVTLFAMLVTSVTPYGVAFAAGNDDGNGDNTTQRYIDYKIYDGASELTEPTPVLPLNVNEKTFTFKVNHQAGVLDGREAKIQYRVTGAGGVEYEKDTVLTGEVGTPTFPSARMDDSFSFDVTFVRDGERTCGQDEVCLPGHKGNYNFSVDIVFESGDLDNQTFVSLSKTIYVDGEQTYDSEDEADYTDVAGDFSYTLKKLKGDGSSISFGDIGYTELSDDKPIPLYIDGFYKPDPDIPKNKKIYIDYSIYAIEEHSDAHLIKHFKQDEYTAINDAYIPFNRIFHVSTKDQKGKPEHNTFLDVAYLNTYPMNYVLRATVSVDGEEKPRHVLDTPLNISDATYKNPEYVMNNSEPLPLVETGKSMSLKLSDVNGDDIHDFDLSKLRQAEGIKADMLGGILLPDIPKGTKVTVEYGLHSFNENFVREEDRFVTTYIQNLETKTQSVGFNKEIYFRVGNPDASDTRPVIFLKDYIAEYILEVKLVYGEHQQIRETLYWKINLINDTVSHLIDSDAPFERESGLLGFELNQVTKDGNGNIQNRTPFEKVSVSTLKDTPKELEISGTLRSPQMVGVDTKFKIGYDVVAVENYSTNTIVKGYIQDEYTRDNEVEFNRLFYLSTKERKALSGAEKDYVYLENYPSNYAVRVFLEDEHGNTHYFKDKQIQLTNNAGEVVNAIDYLLPQTEKKAPTFDHPTRLDVLLQQYDNTGKLATFKEATADEIKQKPLKLNIQSLLRNGELEGTKVEIKFDIVSYETYLTNSINNVMKSYTQNKETRTYHVEANRDIFISTKTREDKSGDDLESTIYLEDVTQHYQVRVEVYNDGQLYLKREYPFKINGINDPNHQAPQEIEGPEIDPNAPISTFLTDPNNDNHSTKRLQITARQLNSKDGIPVDVEGFIKKTWINDEVLIRYDLVALNTYTDYIHGNGVTTTLENDPQAQDNDQNHVLVSTMEEWYGKPSQDNFLKRYKTTNYTKNNYEPFRKQFILRTKIDQEEYKDTPSTLFLDNVARDYRLTVTAKNTATGEAISETIKLDITTVKANENTAPVFNSGSLNVSFRKPDRGSGYFEGEYMPVSWNAATDADDNDTDTEYLYYKIYYYYSTQNNDGSLNEEIQKYMLRYDDMPKAGGILSTEWQVPMSAKIEPAYLRGYACDVNHVCSDFTKSQPFKFNEFGIGQGGSSGGDGNQNNGPSATISINPKPTGKWENEDKEVFVTYEGPVELALGAIKSYEITKNSTVPLTFSKPLGADNKIAIKTEGENYVHVRYVLEDGTEIYTSSGPYKIYKAEVSDFTMQLVDSKGNPVLDWTNQDPILKMTYKGDKNADGIIYQYRIDQHHNEWQTLKDNTTINVEGNRLVYGRVVNKAGTASEQKSIMAKVDKSPVDFKKVNLAEHEDGTYEVSVWANDSLSGIEHLQVVDGAEIKTLTNSATNSIYKISGLQNQPTGITAIDKAGNQNTVVFGAKPAITFADSYDPKDDVYRKGVKAQISNGVVLSYKLGNQYFGCTNVPCEVSIDRNTLLTGINTDGIKQTSKAVRIANIDKSERKLLLDGNRNPNNEKELAFEWNYSLTNGTLICYVGGAKETIPVIDKGKVIHDGQNTIYDCYVEGDSGGEHLKSNRIIIYPDSTKPITGGNGSEIEIKGDVYVEESRTGTTYYINGKRNNLDNKNIYVPSEAFENK